jgi:hypothetical protein
MYSLVRFAFAISLAVACIARAQPLDKLPTPAEPVSLESQERAGGHTIQRHVGKDAEFIRTRVIDQQLDAASTFRDLATAERVCNAALEANKADINSRAFAPREGPANVAYDYDAGRDIGSYLTDVNVTDRRGRARKNKGLKSGATKVKLVIRYNWNQNPPHPFYVLTCYPLPK